MWLDSLRLTKRQPGLPALLEFPRQPLTLLAAAPNTLCCTTRFIHASSSTQRKARRKNGIARRDTVQRLFVTASNGVGGTLQNGFGVTPNGNTYDITEGVTDELGESYPITNGDVNISQLTGGGTYSFLANEPYQAKSPVTGTLTRPGETGSYTYTWEYIPVCTGTSPSDYCGGMWTLWSIALPSGGTYTFSYD
ncbi:MAG TPA: hypothetical protein VGI45_17120, partial [Terracidiphilus sp.]